MPRKQLYFQDTVLDMLDMLPPRVEKGQEGYAAYKRKLWRERAKLASILTPVHLEGKEGHFYNAASVLKYVAECERRSLVTELTPLKKVA